MCGVVVAELLKRQQPAGIFKLSCRIAKKLPSGRQRY